MPKTHDIMAPIGKYNDPQTGVEKTRWLKCGMIVTTQAGKMAIKLDALPVAPMTEEGGLWLQCFVPNQDPQNLHTAAPPAAGFRQAAPQQPNPTYQQQSQGEPPPQTAPAAPAAPQAYPQAGGAFPDDDIPF